MNIYDFINSKDVRNYAQKIGYQFSAPEAAYLVYQSDRKTLQEKMQAWQEIIDTMPDCPIEKRNWLQAAESFHSMLSDYMDLQRRKLHTFYSGEGYVYSYSVCERISGDSMSWREKNFVFSDYEACADYCKKELADEKTEEASKDKSEKIIISKYRVNPDVNDPFTNLTAGCLSLSAEWDVLYLNLNYYDEENADDLDSMFEGMCFDFPIPFHRGDIVTMCGGSTPFVFSYSTTWDSEKMMERGFHSYDCPWGKSWAQFDRHRNELLRRGDSTDMHIFGTYAHQGKLYQDDDLTIPTDLEYYTGELSGYNRQVQAVSMYEKGEIGYELLVNSCFSIRMEEMAKEIRADCALPYRREIMEELGVIPVNS